MATGKLLNFHRRGELDGVGDVLYRGATRRGHGEPDRGQYNAPEAVFGACAEAAMYRRSAFERVGLFDERFFAFYEDVDWNFRAQFAGLTSRYVPSAVAFNMGSATIGQGMTDFARYQLTRNGIWIVAKDFPLQTLLRDAPHIMYVQVAQLVAALRARRAGVWSRGVRDALRMLPAVLHDRRAVQGARVAATSRGSSVRSQHGPDRCTEPAGRASSASPCEGPWRPSPKVSEDEGSGWSRGKSGLTRPCRHVLHKTSTSRRPRTSRATARHPGTPRAVARNGQSTRMRTCRWPPSPHRVNAVSGRMIHRIITHHPHTVVGCSRIRNPRRERDRSHRSPCRPRSRLLGPWSAERVVPLVRRPLEGEGDRSRAVGSSDPGPVGSRRSSPKPPLEDPGGVRP